MKLEMNHQAPDWDYKRGHSVIEDERLFLCGEDDLDELLYGKEEARNLNGKGYFQSGAEPLVDVWIDLRDERSNNRNVYLPEAVEHVKFPFKDGDLEAARKELPTAASLLNDRLTSGQRVVVSCHLGRSRSVMLLLLALSERKGSFFDAYWAIKGKRPDMEPDRNFKPLLEEWKEKYQEKPKEEEATVEGIKHIKGDLLNVKEGIILHQVNCVGVMGAGLADQLQKAYPVIFPPYKRHCDKHLLKPDELLGKVQMIPVTPKLVIGNVFSQVRFGRGAKQTVDKAFEEAFEKAIKYAKKTNQSVYLPKNIGCDLAGGDWGIISGMIEDVCKRNEYGCTIVEYQKR